MNDKEFKQMLADLVAREEKYLQVNSEEFNRRHRELMELIERASRKEWGINGKNPVRNEEESKRII